ncbi:hypothetical protein [Sphingosinicella sp. YJ22]|uniref:hypothetical protein n=1 Tax=Sphingosinicella sp. YJ22 TaxID=1104780 RepID=UPI00140A7D7D|nr:hypothetical protein [Sphingosinicella sp. YJ22]
MSGPGIDLSGHWSGVFSFPYELPPGPFEAQIHDIAGAISGVTTEPGDIYDPPGTTLDATIEGRRSGAFLTFVKTYGHELRPDRVYYRGTVQPCGNEIQGEWTIPGEWSGTFLMIRAAKEETAVRRRASVSV